MSFRTWLYVFAIIGLTGSSALGQTDQQTESSQGQADQQQSPTQVIPIPLPVEIVTDQAESDARKSSEEEAKQREIADLVAQKGMNASTEAIKVATNDMRDYALYSTILVGLGTFLAFCAFILSLLANRSARQAVQVMRREQRPWISIEEITIKSAVFHPEKGMVRFEMEACAKNFGTFPANRVHVRPSMWEHLDHSPEAVKQGDEFQEIGPMPNSEIVQDGKKIVLEMMAVSIPQSVARTISVECWANIPDSEAEKPERSYIIQGTLKTFYQSAGSTDWLTTETNFYVRNERDAPNPLTAFRRGELHSIGVVGEIVIDLSKMN